MKPEKGIENLLAEPVRGDLVETVKTLSDSDMAHQQAPERDTPTGGDVSSC
jgi:hypothetical protein